MKSFFKNIAHKRDTASRMKGYYNIVNSINSVEEKIASMSVEQMQSITIEMKDKIARGASLDHFIVDAFAITREAAKRTLGMRHFDVQLIGGMAMHDGMIAEMRTGEGKTLVATLPSYLNALSGKPVHVVTTNDYLTKRDYEWMSPIFNMLGLKSNFVSDDIDDSEKHDRYNCDIVYVNNSTLGFDYLRDNMRLSRQNMCLVPHGFNYAIIDEVDSILIDEARTPLIISGSSVESSEMYKRIDKIIPKLNPQDYEIDEKSKSIHFTEEGHENLEKLLVANGIITKGKSLYDNQNFAIVNYVNQSMRAHKLFKKNVDYIVKERKVMLIDEFTGRVLDGRRYSGGLHQAIEAKEGVPVQNENQTLASITYQNLFRMYKKLSGMTGTASTEADEFKDIYNIKILSIPTNKPVVSKDMDDVIYASHKEKLDAVVNEIIGANKNGQPILVGTTSVEKSEELSKILDQHKLKHNVLNAKNHAKEAEIVANAGCPGAITISTNMAGRGTDIKLGGNLDVMIASAISGIEDEAKIESIKKEIINKYETDKDSVIKSGGLFVIGVERNESRRIDNQLKGRCGRQGDPGMSKFFLSLQDDLLRIFGGERIEGILKRIGLKENEQMTHPLLSGIIKHSQKKIESMNYDIRKNLIKYDDIMNEQRKIFYEKRFSIMDSENVILYSKEMLHDFLSQYFEDDDLIDSEKIKYYESDLQPVLGSMYNEIINSETTNLNDMVKNIGIKIDEKMKKISEKISSHNESEMNASEVLSHLIRGMMMESLDQSWKYHLDAISHLREGIHFRSYAQKDPFMEYKIESYKLFDSMFIRFNSETLTKIVNFDLIVDL
jgi:preprotein translocase subunit SecA